MKKSISLGAACALLILAHPSPALAQAVAADANQLAGALPTATAETTAHKEPRFDIELDSGLPAQEAVARVSGNLKQPINVIFTGDSAEMPLPALRLHQVTLTEFFAAVQAAGEHEAINGGRGYRFAPVDGAPNIYTFSAQAAPGTPGQPEQATEKTSLFFDLSTILDDKMTVDDLTTAIRTAWAAAGGAEAAPEALKFHQETKLLIATGTPARLEAVSNIVRLLQTRQQPKKEQQTLQLERLLREVQALSDTRDQLLKKLDKAEQSHEQEKAELRGRLEDLRSEQSKQQRSN